MSGSIRSEKGYGLIGKSLVTAIRLGSNPRFSPAIYMISS